MKCEKYQEYFEEFLSNILSTDFHDTIQEHVDACEECADVLKRFKIIRSGLMTLSYDTEIPEEDLEHLNKELMRKIFYSNWGEIAKLDFPYKEEIRSLVRSYIQYHLGKDLYTEQFRKKIGR